jgi:hypothetical protein
MTMRTRFCVVVLLIGALTPVTSWCASDVMLGIKGGLNLANFTGEDVFHNSSSEGFAGGVFMRYPLSNSWSFQPEALFTMRGAEFSVEDIETEQQMNYIEMPLLARFGWGHGAMFRPALFIGPSVAFLLKNKIVDGAEIDLKDGSRDVDVGGILGADLEHNLGAGEIILDARYEMGFISWTEDLSARNSTLSFMIGYARRFGSRSTAGTGTEGLR